MFGKTTGRVVWMLAFAVLLMPGIARAEIDLGVRTGFYSDADTGFLGAELLMDVTRQWFFNPNFEYVFVDNGHLYTLNLDAHYDFPTRSPYSVWAGGGPAVIFNGFDAPPGCRRCRGTSDTDLGLNLLGGVGFGKRQPIRPYIQGKVTLSNNTEASIAFGIRFY